MTMEERVRFLLRIASREEDEGNERTARLFRRMAEESQPLELEPLEVALQTVN